jgi:hypothetical protein
VRCGVGGVNIVFHGFLRSYASDTEYTSLAA